MRNTIKLTSMLLVITIMTVACSSFAFANTSYNVEILESTTVMTDGVAGTDDEEEAPIIWPLVGAWVSSAVAWLSNNSQAIAHIMNNIGHKLAQAGITTVNQMLNLVRQTLTYGQAVHQGGNVWYFFWSWNGWAVEIHGAIVDGIYRISTMFLN